MGSKSLNDFRPIRNCNFIKAEATEITCNCADDNTSPMKIHQDFDKDLDINKDGISGRGCFVTTNELRSLVERTFGEVKDLIVVVNYNTDTSKTARTGVVKRVPVFGDVMKMDTITTRQQRSLKLKDLADIWDLLNMAIITIQRRPLKAEVLNGFKDKIKLVKNRKITTYDFDRLPG